MSLIIRSAMAVLTLCLVCGCGISNLAVRAAPTHSPLRLELATIDGEVHSGAHVTLHARLWNTSAAPVRNVEFAFSHAPSLVPVGGTGSTVVHTDYGALHVERIARLEPGGLAEWWIVLRAVTSGDANARAIAVLDASGDASFETVQWRVIDATGVPDERVVKDDDPVRLARAYLALSQEHRASGRHRDELHALYAARVFIDQAAPERIADTPWADFADRAGELYVQEYGAGPSPLLQAALSRSSILTGVVLDKVSQAPIADATITLRSTLTDAIYAMVTTSAEGAYQITNLGVEPSVMIAAMAGYQTTLRAGFELCPNATTRLITELEPEPVVTRASAFEGWDLAELHGTLSGYRGNGASDVEVMLVGADTRAVLTDEQGQFQFTDVIPGDYTFVAIKPGFAAIELRALNVTPGGVVEVQFTLEPER